MALLRHYFVASAALGLLVASSAGAQSATPPHTSIGPVVGLNYTTFGGSDATKTDSRADFLIGAQLDNDIGTNGFFRSGVVYSRRGAKTSDTGGSVTAKLSYIEIPIMFGYRIPTTGRVRPFLMVGGHYGIKTACTLDETSGGATVTNACTNFGDFNSGDLAVGGGGGLLIPAGGNALSLDLRYTAGLTKIEKSTDIKNRGFTLGLGWMIPIR